MSAHDDVRWMALALSVARRATPAPNPRVGAVVVAHGRFVALGWHGRVGGPHAEAIALAAAEGNARAGTLYVTLEPCNHYGKTPPCASAILAAGVKRVVIGTRDPNPHVTGGGATWLRDCGIEVCVGVLAHEAQQLVEEWAERFTRRRESQPPIMRLSTPKGRSSPSAS
jgi:diaminohydroxyphosphoribosylaminopyrimidine deaminase/5-amino-6-(5-phosphoribosylamino)uracil reductase